MGTSPVRSPASPPVAALMRPSWNTARVFSDYLLANPSLTRNQRILELGAGAGLPGFIAALTGAKQVTITDYPDHELVENISWNVKMNLSTESLDRVKVEVSYVVARCCR